MNEVINTFHTTILINAVKIKIIGDFSQHGRRG